MSEQTLWNGEPTECRRVSVVVADDQTFPQYWARTEGIVGQRIPAVEVLYFDEPFYLDDRNGSGWLKVTTGHGSPAYGHREVTPEPGSVEVVA